ncbi:YpjP family protein [Tuberibacillus sp. Marseille-P3662]|uniref:YpjP family protein n=1 Tax=Tuberibacillus sp. Marseille-P3662 TaxID=1965358 RepID=UPI000A1CD35D|nr:YpjP family protein [Tuberibacillus sp. Marseille-P3662]
MPKLPKWLKKSFVTMVTVLTLGTVVPQVNIQAESKPSNTDIEGSKDHKGLSSAATVEQTLVVDQPTEQADFDANETLDSWPEIAATINDNDELLARFNEYTREQAESQGFAKFGDTISAEIGPTYSQKIVPKFGDAVLSLANTTDDHLLKFVDVSNNPAGGTGERILNVYDTRTGEEMIKFHVRRDHPPQEGYWFNFHYHTYEDGFQSHRELEKVYWDKNMPPKWVN